VVLDDPSRNIQLLLVKDAPPRARVATGATLCLMIICATSLLRRRIRLGYRTWRFIHITLAAAALILTGLHIYWLRHLVEDARMRNWYLVSTAILLLVLANRWVLRPLRAAGADYVIEELRSESTAVTTVVLRPRHSWQRGLRFTAGQFAWLRIHGKYWDEHPFTIASSAEHPRRLEFTIRDVGTFTTRIPALQPGTRVRLDGPHGAFTVPAATTRPLLMIAGGVGITPMMSILRTMAHRGEQAPCLLVVGARREDELLFRDELHSLQSQLDLQVIEVLSEPPPGWTGSTGRVGEELISQLLPTRQLRNLIGLYVCGPSGMVASMRDIAVARGVPLERIHTEQFDMV
jgi:predicted ferric reductase